MGDSQYLSLIFIKIFKDYIEINLIKCLLLIRKISSCGGNGSIILDNETTVDKGLELLYFLTILDTDNIYECYDFLYLLKI